MTTQFMYLVVRERRCVMLDLTQICPIAVYFDKGEADRHAQQVQHAAEQALGELTSYRQSPAPHIILALDPTCSIDEDTYVGYSVESVPFVAEPLGSEGLHPWTPVVQNPAQGVSTGLQTALGAAFARLKQGGPSLAA